MISKFEINDIVCLTFDKSKRFIVINSIIPKGDMVTVAYFNEYKGEILGITIPEEYLVKVDPKE